MAEQTFEEFLQHRRRVAAAFVDGDPKPLREISATTDPATFFGPGGGLEHGNAQVVAGNEKAARQFQKGGTTELELLHSGSDGDLGYWTGFQHANLNLEGHVAPTPMKLRVTEVFRRERGQWKLMHRHADPLADVKPAT